MDDESEHDRLKRITQNLEREHEAVHDMPHDREAHRAHRDKLHHHIQELHAYIERLKNKHRFRVNEGIRPRPPRP